MLSPEETFLLDTSRPYGPLSWRRTPDLPFYTDTYVPTVGYRHHVFTPSKFSDRRVFVFDAEDRTGEPQRVATRTCQAPMSGSTWQEIHNRRTYQGKRLTPPHLGNSG